MNILRVVVLAAAVASVPGAASAVPVVADSVNGNSVAAGDLIFGANIHPKVEHGWVYTPSTSFDLTGIKTKFGAAGGQTIHSRRCSGGLGESNGKRSAKTSNPA